MSPRTWGRSMPALLGIAVFLGLTIAAVDNFAFGGEVSPIVVVGMLLVATAIVGVLGGRRAWWAALVVWVCVPLAHVLKHSFGIPDTLQPNTYASIAKLAVFTLVVALIGTTSGVLASRKT